MRSTRFVSLTATLVLAAAPAAPAQVTLEVQQSTTWTTALTIPEPQAMSFPCKGDTGKPLATAWEERDQHSPVVRGEPNAATQP